MSLGGNSGTQTTTTSQSIDPWLKGVLQQNIDRSTGIADQGFTPYTGTMTAGLSPNQSAAVGQAGLLGGASTTGALTGIDTAQRLAGFTPAQISPGTLNTSMAAAAGTPRAAVTNLVTGDVAGGMAPYRNPYTQQVIDASLSDLDRARQMAIGGNTDRAIAAGAFGGSRQGVADSLTNEAFARQAAQTAAGLRSQGFDTALGAAQQDAGRNLTAQQANQNADLSVYGQNTQNQQQANLTNAGILNNANLFNANAYNDAQRQNQAAGIAGAGINANAAGLLGQFGQQGLGGLLSTGSVAQGAQQAGLDSAYQEFLRMLNQPYQGQSLINQSLGLLPQGGTTTQTGPKPDNTGGLLGGLGSLIGGIAGIRW